MAWYTHILLVLRWLLQSFSSDVEDLAAPEEPPDKRKGVRDKRKLRKERLRNRELQAAVDEQAQVIKDLGENYCRDVDQLTEGLQELQTKSSQVEERYLGIIQQQRAETAELRQQVVNSEQEKQECLRKAIKIGEERDSQIKMLKEVKSALELNQLKGEQKQKEAELKQKEAEQKHKEAEKRQKALEIQQKEAKLKLMEAELKQRDLQARLAAQELINEEQQERQAELKKSHAELKKQLAKLQKKQLDKGWKEEAPWLLPASEYLPVPDHLLPSTWKTAPVGPEDQKSHD